MSHTTKSTIQGHLDSQKHQAAVETMKKKEKARVECCLEAEAEAHKAAMRQPSLQPHATTRTRPPMIRSLPSSVLVFRWTSWITPSCVLGCRSTPPLPVACCKAALTSPKSTASMCLTGTKEQFARRLLTATPHYFLTFWESSTILTKPHFTPHFLLHFPHFFRTFFALFSNPGDRIPPPPPPAEFSGEMLGWLSGVRPTKPLGYGDDVLETDCVMCSCSVESGFG